MKKYSFLETNRKYFKNYSLVPLRKSDIQNIRRWRNEQIQILRQKTPLSKNDQNHYYENTIKKSFFVKKPKMIIFSFLLSGKCIGYGGFTRINWTKRSSELSFILDTKRVQNSKIYEKEFKIFLKLILELNDEQIKFKKIFTETYNIRPIHLRILENMSFRYRKIKRNFIKIHGKYVDSLIHEYKLN